MRDSFYVVVREGIYHQADQVLDEWGVFPVYLPVIPTSNAMNDVVDVYNSTRDVYNLVPRDFEICQEEESWNECREE